MTGSRLGTLLPGSRLGALAALAMGACTREPRDRAPEPVVVPVAVAEPLPDASSGARAPPPQSSPALRGIDWCNHDYGAALPALTECRGSFAERHRAGGGIHTFDEFRLVSVTYGDLTGDGREDALLLIEGERRPVIRTFPPTPFRQLMLVEQRGTDLYAYPAVAIGEAAVVDVAIANGVAILRRRLEAGTCSEAWRLVGEELRGSACK
jgi:hypothetical protein